MTVIEYLLIITYVSVLLYKNCSISLYIDKKVHDPILTLLYVSRDSIYFKGLVNNYPVNIVGNTWLRLAWARYLNQTA